MTSPPTRPAKHKRRREPPTTVDDALFSRTPISTEKEVEHAMTAVGIGLVGAGPWAQIFHAPMITGGPETELTAVWARRPEAAQEIAEQFNANVATSFEALLGSVDALVFGVPPFIQAELAAQAALAGKPMLLEKPIGVDLAQAEKLVQAIDEAGVATQVMFTNRYSPRIRQ